MAGVAVAQVGALSDLQREQREQIEQWERQSQRSTELPRGPAPSPWLPPLDGEQPCVVLKAVQIEPSPDLPAQAAPRVPPTLRQPPADYLGRCIGVASLHRLQVNLQGRLHRLGYITSTLEMGAQNLQAGVLHLSLRWGRLAQVHMEFHGQDTNATHLPALNSLAVKPGEVLNLRDIEHTLENLARLPSQAARFLIEPGSKPHESDLRIVVMPQSRLRGSLGLDAADIRADSPWDLQAQVWLDAPFGHSDQLMVSASGSPAANGELRTRRHSVYAAWSVPWGRHLLSLSASMARHDRSIAGGVGRFREHGEEDRAAFRWQWTPARGPNWRTHVWSAWAERRSRSHIDDVELLSRRRFSSEWSVGTVHWHRLGCGEAGLELDSTHTRRLARVAEFQDLDAPKPRHWRVQIDVRCALPSTPHGESEPGWVGTLQAWTQAVERPFDGSDLLALGGRYAIRGHRADQALTGQRISVAHASVALPWQRRGSALAWQPWLGWDVGRLERGTSDSAATVATSRTLQAAVIGLRWQAWSLSGELSWARATGAMSGPPGGQWQASVVGWF